MTGQHPPATPILPGFHPDPTICRVGEDYYLATSSFEYFPGAPIWHSPDLLHWNQIGHILDRRSQFSRGRGLSSTGLYAGTLRHHAGLFHYVTTNVGGDEPGQILVTATDPAGPWSDPVHIPDAEGIDPDLAWDEAGACYLTWKALSFGEGEIGIRQARLDTTTGALLDEPYPVWQGSGLAAAEGPHLYAVRGRWYLLLAEGGTERGHAVTIARGPSPAGPFAACPANPILTHRSSIDPVQNTGHADLVETSTGEWAAVYLGVRPLGSTPGFHVLGRETFLAGVDWRDGWPVVDEARYAVPPMATVFTDDFSGPALGPHWVVPGGEPAAAADLVPGGGLRLHPPGDHRGGSTGLLCTRIRDLRWSAEAVFEGDGRFLVRVDDRHHYGLERRGAEVVVPARIGDLDSVIARAPVPAGPVLLRIAALDPATPQVPFGHAGPDDIVLGLGGPEPSDLARLDGRYLSTEVASGFTGRMLALGATERPAAVRSLTYRPEPAPGSDAPARRPDGE